MSFPAQNVNFRIDEKTLKKLADIQDAFSLLSLNRTYTIRMSIKICHALIFTPGKPDKVLQQVQRLLRAVRAGHLRDMP
jgi:hypothetical protein